MAILIAVQAVAVAQNPHPKDTIFNREPTYFYDSLWHDSADYYIPMSERVCEYHNGCAGAFIETGKYFHTDSTLKIVGVAVSIKTGTNPYGGDCSVFIDGEMRNLPTDSSFDNWYEYLRLYEPSDTGLVMLEQGTFNAVDTARRMRLFEHKQCDYSSPGYDTMVYTSYVPIYEVYFDKPVTMTGTFVVSVTSHNDILDRQSYSYPGLGARPIYICSRNFRNPVPVTCDHHHVRLVEYSLLSNWIVREFDDDNAECDVLIFPIIDTVQPPKCEAVTGMSVYQDSAAAIVSWSRGENNLGWQVAYGLASEDPEGYAVVSAASEAYALRDLTPGEEYAVRVRANCFIDTTYSDWSDTLRFTRPTATQGIDPAALAPHVCLSPNPAHGKVSVCSAFALRRITLYDMQGRPALDTDAQGLTATLGISALPKGTYLVGILTAHGHCTQRLVVE